VRTSGAGSSARHRSSTSRSSSGKVRISLHGTVFDEMNSQYRRKEDNEPHINLVPTESSNDAVEFRADLNIDIADLQLVRPAVAPVTQDVLEGLCRRYEGVDQLGDSIGLGRVRWGGRRMRIHELTEHIKGRNDVK